MLLRNISNLRETRIPEAIRSPQKTTYSTRNITFD